MNYKVSIIIPYYKKKLFFLETLKSAINQTYKNFEIIIIYDDTLKTDLKYIEQIITHYKKIKLLINNKNYGVAYSRNKGIKYAKGDFIAFLDADDIWDIKKLAIQIRFMRKNCINFSHTSYRIIDEKNFLIGRQVAKKYTSYFDLLKSCDIGLSTVIFKKNIINKDPFPKLKTKEDYALWLKLSKKNKIYGLKRTLSSWRKSKKSLSSSIFQKYFAAFKVYYIEENLNFFISIYRVLILSYFYLFKRIKQKTSI
jgi:teichuronic acid biosynthesis glycosyltransferase TuaG